MQFPGHRHENHVPLQQVCLQRVRTKQNAKPTSYGMSVCYRHNMHNTKIMFLNSLINIYSYILYIYIYYIYIYTSKCSKINTVPKRCHHHQLTLHFHNPPQQQKTKTANKPTSILQQTNKQTPVRLSFSLRWCFLKPKRVF